MNNMDEVEAILANVDSDEEGELNIQGLSLEDILREAEEEDDEQGRNCSSCFPNDNLTG